ncbi:hypothetical protein I6E29_02600 [Arcanobacterium haemolyticum]|nr:hypothetical protein [Arcanobacterium haemolyticum]
MSDSVPTPSGIPLPQAPVDPEKVLGAVGEMGDGEALDALDNLLAVLTRDLGKAQA